MIKQLREENKRHLAQLDSKIDEYHNSILSFSLIEDPHFYKSNAPTVSLSEQNDKLNQLQEQLEYLNDLWVIKGLISEIESCIELCSDEEFYVSDLESIYNNFNKVQTKVSNLNPLFLIKLEVNNKVNSLIEECAKVLEFIFKRFLPNSEEFQDNVNDVQFCKFLSIVDQLGTISEKISIHSLIQDYKLIWEKQLLQISSTSYLNPKMELTVVEASVEVIFKSLLNFVEFINRLEIQSLKVFFAAKLTQKLTNAISENIDNLIKPNGISDTFIQVIEVLDHTDWNLSIGLTLTNINEKLNEVHANWLIDNYIARIRRKFNDVDLNTIKLLNIKWSLDKKRLSVIEEKISIMEKKINKAMVEESTVDSENADGWNDEWNDWEESDPEPETPSKIVARQWNEKPLLEEHSESTTIKISLLPNDLIEIINDFQIESTQDIDLLVSTILALSSVSYPPITNSFLYYNDLEYLYKNLQHEEFHRNSQMLIKQLKHQTNQEISKILMNIKLEDQLLNKTVFDLNNQWFQAIFSTNLKYTNFLEFKEIIHSVIDFINDWLIQLIINNDDITEIKSNSITNIIDHFEAIYVKYLKLIEEVEFPESLNKLLNYKFLVNNHLVDIIERFYKGDFYNLSTDELVHIIKLCFVKSELRDNYINEIIEFRNIQ